MAKTTVEVLASGGHIRWAVLWVVPDGSSYRIIRKDFDGDLDAAIELYTKAKRGGKRLVTLMSPNVAFPPPEKYRPYTRRTVEVREVKVMRNGKYVTRKQKTLTPKYIDPMLNLNRKGIFWCPYCREMRKFQQQAGFQNEYGTFMEAPGLYCPLCGVSHRLMPVRQWNPHCSRLYAANSTTRRTKSRTQRSTTRSTNKSGTRSKRRS
jgi:hypothetical protein